MGQNSLVCLNHLCNVASYERNKSRLSSFRKFKILTNSGWNLNTNDHVFSKSNLSSLKSSLLLRLVLKKQKSWVILLKWIIKKLNSHNNNLCLGFPFGSAPSVLSKIKKLYSERHRSEDLGWTRSTVIFSKRRKINTGLWIKFGAPLKPAQIFSLKTCY